MIDVTLTLYRHRKTGDFLIQRFFKTRAAGKFVTASAAEMQERGLDIVLKLLNDKSPAEPGATSELNNFTKEEERVFYRQHRHVCCWFEKEGVLALGPERRQGSGYVVRKDEVVELSSPFTNENFLEALNRIYDEW
jgi:DNA-binding GntR family transcriptional regulator